MVPLCDARKARHITLDTTALYKLLRDVDDQWRAAKQAPLRFDDGDSVPATEREFHINAEQWWRRVLDVQRFERPGIPSLKFKGTLYTDGVSVSLVQQRDGDGGDDGDDPEAAAAEAEAAVTGKKAPKVVTPFSQWPKLEEVDPHKVTGVDPGRRDFVSAARTGPPPSHRRRRKHWRRAAAGARGRGRGRRRPKRHHRHGGRRKRRRHQHGYKTFSVSMRAWRVRSGNRAAQDKRTRWLQQDRNASGDARSSLCAQLKALPSGRVPSGRALQLRIAAVEQLLPRLLAGAQRAAAPCAPAALAHAHAAHAGAG